MHGRRWWWWERCGVTRENEEGLRENERGVGLDERKRKNCARKFLKSSKKRRALVQACAQLTLFMCIYNISSSWDVEASLHWSLDKIPISHVACPGRGRGAEAVGDPLLFKPSKADRAAPSIAIRLFFPPPIPITTPSTAFKEVSLSLTVNNEGRSYYWLGLPRHWNVPGIH